MTQVGLQGIFVEEVCAADSGIAISPIPAVNVATVPQRSPLRYPGGKTWLVPHIRAWLAAGVPAPRLLIEPFAGGGIASLTSVMEGLVDRCLMAEIDPDVAAFWHAALRHGAELSERVTQFTLTRESVEALALQHPDDIGSRAAMTPTARLRILRAWCNCSAAAGGTT